MNTYVVSTLHGLQSQVAGPRYIEHHFGWWSLVWWASMFGFIALAKFADRFCGPSQGKGFGKFLRQLKSGFFGLLVGALRIAAAVACIGGALVTLMWIIAQRHHPGNM